MDLRHFVGLVGGCAALGMVAGGAEAQVFAEAQATTLIRFLKVREITNGVPVGPTGLVGYYGGIVVGGQGYFAPPQNIVGGYGNIHGQPIAHPGFNAPPPNTGFSDGIQFTNTAFSYGFGSRGAYSSTTITYSNVTNGNSMYEIEGEISINLSLSSDLTDPARESVFVTGIVIIGIVDESGFVFDELIAFRISGASASRSVSSPVFPFTMRIGNIGGGFRRDFAQISVNIDLLATMLAVPTPGVLVLMSMAGLLAVQRRRR